MDLRFQLFVWRICKRNLPLKIELIRHHVDCQSICPFCHSENEDFEHLFLNCSFSKEVWFGLPIGLRTTELAICTFFFVFGFPKQSNCSCWSPMLTVFRLDKEKLQQEIGSLWFVAGLVEELGWVWWQVRTCIPFGKKRP